MANIYDTLIIGGGPAGYTAALYAARAGLNTLLLEKMSPGGQMGLTDVIENYPGFPEGIDGFTLGMQMQAGAEQFGAKTEYGEVLTASLTGEIKTVRTDGGEYEAKTVILATGANPRILGLERESSLVGRGVHYCAHCDGRFYKNKTVMVVGGGNSAVSDAAYLSRLCKKVFLVHRRDTLRATKIYHDPLMQAENVEFLWNSTVTALHGEPRLTEVTVTDVKTGESRVVAIDGLFVSVGRVPVTEPFSGEITLDERGYVVADETTKTNIPGVFAAGDIRTKILRQVVTAVSDGAVAAHFAEEYLSQQG